MRRWLVLLFLADLAALPFMIGAFAGGSSSTEPATSGSPRAVSTATLPSFDPCELLKGGAGAQYQGVIDHYGDIRAAAAVLGIEDAECR